MGLGTPQYSADLAHPFPASTTQIGIALMTKIRLTLDVSLTLFHPDFVKFGIRYHWPTQAPKPIPSQGAAARRALPPAAVRARAAPRVHDRYGARTFRRQFGNQPSFVDASQQARPQLLRGDHPVSNLPRCPRCNELLRPAVVCFDEPLDRDMITGRHQQMDR